ncbi:PTS sugar transporter subunit IIB [Lacticaseibacillus paracasei]|uniref:PTS sugar transporter subunit IIB n=1 Tax=Lacticaseibacillus paracasei TaxID=1597 RepID=UPI0031D4418A
MTEKKIMLVCAAGMSTSMLVARMQKAAEKDGIEVNIFATAASDADNKLAEEKPDVLMLGPQVRYLEGQFKKDLDIPVDVINMQEEARVRRCDQSTDPAHLAHNLFPN